MATKLSHCCKHSATYLDIADFPISVLAWLSSLLWIHTLQAKFTLVGNTPEHSPEILVSLTLDTILINPYLSFILCAASMFCLTLIYGKDFTEDKHEIEKCKMS